MLRVCRYAGCGRLFDSVKTNRKGAAVIVSKFRVAQLYGFSDRRKSLFRFLKLLRIFLIFYGLFFCKKKKNYEREMNKKEINDQPINQGFGSGSAFFCPVRIRINFKKNKMRILTLQLTKSLYTLLILSILNTM